MISKSQLLIVLIVFIEISCSGSYIATAASAKASSGNDTHMPKSLRICKIEFFKSEFLSWNYIQVTNRTNPSYQLSFWTNICLVIIFLTIILTHTLTNSCPEQSINASFMRLLFRSMANIRPLLQI
jgi:hypothetical protein